MSVLLKRCLFSAIIACSWGCSEEMSSNNNTSLVESTKKVKESIVCFVAQTPRGLDIQATGFFIHEDGLVATAGHVVKETNLKIAYQNKFYDYEVLRPNFGLVFNADVPEKRKVIVWDVAVVKILGEKRLFPSVQLTSRKEFEQGESIATLGYYYRGTSFSVGNETNIYALLAQGVIAMSIETSNTLTKEIEGYRLVLDISAGPGSSGSPAFDPATGEVYGVVSSAKLVDIYAPSEKDGPKELKRIPIGVTNCDPVNQLADFLESYSKDSFNTQAQNMKEASSSE